MCHRLLKQIAAVALAALASGGAHAAADQDEIDWIRQTAFVLDTVEFVDGHEDLLPLLPLFGGARIVALGEGTHGTREFFTTRSRLIEFLAIELGFTAFAFEFPYGEGTEVNEYIQEGVGDPAEILARVYCPPWNHEEMLSLIEWMRTHNATPGRTQTLTFHGIDIHDGSTVLLVDSLLRFIEGVDPAQVDAFESALECFRYRSMSPIGLPIASRSGGVSLKRTDGRVPPDAEPRDEGGGRLDSTRLQSTSETGRRLHGSLILEEAEDHRPVAHPFSP